MPIHMFNKKRAELIGSFLILLIIDYAFTPNTSAIVFPIEAGLSTT